MHDIFFVCTYIVTKIDCIMLLPCRVYVIYNTYQKNTKYSKSMWQTFNKYKIDVNFQRLILFFYIISKLHSKTNLEYINLNVQFQFVLHSFFFIFLTTTHCFYFCTCQSNISSFCPSTFLTMARLQTLTIKKTAPIYLLKSVFNVQLAEFEGEKKTQMIERV